jgi:MFS family permease
MITATQSSTRNASPARIGALWFGVQAIWGAVLGISLQARCAQLAPQHALATFSALAAFGAFAAAVTQLCAGPFSDFARRGGDDRTRLYVAGSVLGAIAAIAFYAVPTIDWLFVAYILLQIGLNIVIGPYQAVAPDTLQRERYGIGAAWLAAYASGGNAFGAVLAVILGTHIGLGIVLALTLAVCAAITVVHVRRVGLVALPPAAPLVMTRSLVDLWISRAFVYLGFYTLLDYLYFYVASLLPHDFFLNATSASGACLLLFTLLGALGAALAARPSDRADERRIVTIGGGIVVAATLVLATRIPLGVLPVAVGAAGVGWGVFLCADWAFACRILPAGALATTMALWNLAVVIPQMVAPLVASLLLSRFNAFHGAVGPHIALLLAGAEMLIGTLWVWRLPYVQGGK